MKIINLIIFFLFGSCIGSFLNVVILRLPENQKLTGRSHCPSCKKTLGPLELVPLFSFLFLSGKCRHCGKKISPRYFIIELVCGLLFALSWLILQPSAALGYAMLIKYFLVISALIVVFVVDLEQYLILDSVIFSATLAVLVLNLIINILGRSTILSFHGYFLGSLVAAMLTPLPFLLIWYFSKGAWMGFGDVKLAVFLGGALGLSSGYLGIMLGIILGGFFSVFLLVFTSKTLKSQVPFGTFLSVGAVIALFYGEVLLHWYLAILGY